jgi:biopolymer transport protein ExbD
MSRPKMARKSTFVDMTAMCDVAFLLLTFFILTTKFKPDEAIAVITPKSVSAQPAPEKDVTLVTMTKEGKVFISLDNEEVKEELANQMNERNNAGLTPDEIKLFKKASFYGAPISQTKSFLQIPKEKLTGEGFFDFCHVRRKVGQILPLGFDVFCFGSCSCIFLVRPVLYAAFN